MMSGSFSVCSSCNVCQQTCCASSAVHRNQGSRCRRFTSGQQLRCQCCAIIRPWYPQPTAAHRVSWKHLYGAQVQGREGTTFTPEPCRWRLNWYIWCPVTLTIAGAYDFTVTYKGTAIPKDWFFRKQNGPANPTTNALTHVNPAPAQRHLFTYDPPLARTLTAGAAATGALQMWDRFGNRGLPVKIFSGFDSQYFDGNGDPWPDAARGTFGSTSQPFTTDPLTNTITRVNCASGCGASGNVTMVRDVAVIGRVAYNFYFEKVGTYRLDVTFKGALPVPRCVVTKQRNGESQIYGCHFSVRFVCLTASLVAWSSLVLLSILRPLLFPFTRSICVKRTLSRITMRCSRCCTVAYCHGPCKLVGTNKTRMRVQKASLTVTRMGQWLPSPARPSL